MHIEFEQTKFNNLKSNVGFYTDDRWIKIVLLFV